jgi:hypothetical protein
MFLYKISMQGVNSIISQPIEPLSTIENVEVAFRFEYDDLLYALIKTKFPDIKNLKVEKGSVLFQEDVNHNKTLIRDFIFKSKKRQ